MPSLCIRNEIRPVLEAAREEGRARCPRCQEWGCNRKATRCYVWRTPSMPASAFWYRCDKHEVKAVDNA